jgi:hypothetical protein
MAHFAEECKRKKKALPLFPPDVPYAVCAKEHSPIAGGDVLRRANGRGNCVRGRVRASRTAAGAIGAASVTARITPTQFAETQSRDRATRSPLRRP